MSAHKAKLSTLQEIGVVGCPANWGQPRPGVERGPGIIRDAHLVDRLQRIGRRVTDHGDIHGRDWSSEELASEHRNVMVADVNESLRKQVASVLAAGHFPLTLGGDHAFAIGSISAVLEARPQVGVVWVDAHADINTPELSGSGNIHGMPVSFLMDLDQTRSHWPRFSWMASLPKLAANRIVYIGLRDVDEPEKNFLHNLGIRAYSMHEVDALGIERVMAETLAHLSPDHDHPLHLSFDIDGLDPVDAPSTGTAVPGGLSVREGRYICETMHATGFLGSMDMMEVNPGLGSEQDAHRTADTAVRMVLAAMGDTLL